MLRDPPPTNAEILPEVSQRSYFFNRIGQKLPITGWLLSIDSAGSAVE
jgi:hypothetical protein